MDLVKAGTVITIVVSLLGLLLTGIGTLYGALVAQDQLEQSQEDAEAKRRAQAARVSYWADRQQDGTWRVHVMNRSPDPIANVGLGFEAHFVPGLRESVAFTVRVPSVPPCSDMVVEQEALRYIDLPRTNDELVFPQPLQGDLPDYRKLDANPGAVRVEPFRV
ncbi:hypothetical protein [Streptomyces cupreus]|uniref:Uncharacterized protein n=1 Tax=Streptomyces cupreus TaxID=2759956 RepID=A0A7X1J8R9_9ACTN|nr:hypothetical protein [Streptomyces cupreus]MBC2906211.1 hypothetical protein [Streptomyces cupreus]